MPCVRRLATLVVALLAPVAACDAGSSGGAPAPAFGSVSVSIDAVVPVGTLDVIWDLELVAEGDPVLFPWSKRVAASTYGNGSYAINYRGRCAPGVTNTLTATLVGVYDARKGALGEFGDPAPDGALPIAVDAAPLVVDVACAAGEEVYVRRDPALVPTPVELLAGPSLAVGDWACAPSLGCGFDDTGDRARLTLGLTCAVPDNVISRPELALGEVALVCDGEPVATFDPTSDGHSGDVEVAISHARSDVDGGRSARWEVALDVPTSLLEAADCHLQSVGTACEPALPDGFFSLHSCSGGRVVAGAVHAYALWDAAVSRGGDVLCWNRDLGTDGIAAFYTAYDAVEDMAFPYLWGAWE